MVGLCGYRLDRAAPPLWATGLPGGLFGSLLSGDDLLVVESIRDALAVLATGYEAVVAPGRTNGFSRRDIEKLANSEARRVAVVGEDTSRLVERLAVSGIDARPLSAGAPLSHLLPTARDPRRALDMLLAGATTPISASPELVARGRDEATIEGGAAELFVTVGSRRWRVRGADRNRVPDVLRVALSVTDTSTGAFHLDTLDLYVAKARAAFLDAAAGELSADHAGVRRELAEVVFAAESALASAHDTQPVAAMSEQERDEALALLADPNLLDRVAADLAALGVVGERTNLLVAYLATVSRKAERPLGVVIQSSSAAGKSTLADAVCSLVPEEDLASFSALTGQALYYVSGQSLTHKVLAVAEEQGASRASYALKLLLTEGRLSIASTGKDPATGQLRTTSYGVTGPVALVMTTTATDIDPELANRVIVLGVDEDANQTRAIHAAQRRAVTLDGLLTRLRRDPLLAVHRNAQRLLDPLPVVIPDAEALSFPADAVRHRRDHQKLLALITASALLHQHQRTRRTVDVAGQPVTYLEATPADIDLATGLAAVVLPRAGEELAPQTRRVLDGARQLTADRAAPDAPGHIAFTRRELRERLGATEHQVRAALIRLTALEYVTAVPGPPGSSNLYTVNEPLEPAQVGQPVTVTEAPCESGSQGQDALRPAETSDPAGLRPENARGTTRHGNVNVDTAPAQP